MAFAIESRFREVEKIILAAQERGADQMVAANYCKLGSVMLCGAIERSVEIIITERIGGKTAPQVSAFLKSYFKRGTNYDCDEIKNLLFRFDRNWGQKFETFVSKNDKIKSSVASCYGIRNSIAHGNPQSLSPKILLQYYEDALSLIAGVEKILRS